MNTKKFNVDFCEYYYAAQNPNAANDIFDIIYKGESTIFFGYLIECSDNVLGVVFTAFIKLKSYVILKASFIDVDVDYLITNPNKKSSFCPEEFITIDFPREDKLILELEFAQNQGRLYSQASDFMLPVMIDQSNLKESDIYNTFSHKDFIHKNPEAINAVSQYMMILHKIYNEMEYTKKIIMERYNNS